MCHSLPTPGLEFGASSQSPSDKSRHRPAPNPSRNQSLLCHRLRRFLKKYNPSRPGPSSHWNTGGIKCLPRPTDAKPITPTRLLSLLTTQEEAPPGIYSSHTLHLCSPPPLPRSDAHLHSAHRQCKNLGGFPWSANDKEKILPEHLLLHSPIFHSSSTYHYLKLSYLLIVLMCLLPLKCKFHEIGELVCLIYCFSGLE